MSAKFPRGGSKPILSHPSNWETFAFLSSGKSHRDGCTEYEQLVWSHIGLDEQGFQSKIVNILLP